MMWSDFIEMIRRVIGRQSLVGEKIELERALEILVSHITSHPNQGMPITFFFPDYANLKPVEVRGIPPVEGREVFLREMELHSPEDQNYREWFGWIVKSVTYSIIPITDWNCLIRKAAFGEGGHSYRVEVQLHKGRRWRDAYPIPSDK